jgi:hypothetical protein
MTLVIRQTEVSNRLVWELVLETGLRFTTVRNLLGNGWTYDQSEPPTWVAPDVRAVQVPRGLPSDSD